MQPASETANENAGGAPAVSYVVAILRLPGEREQLMGLTAICAQRGLIPGSNESGMVAGQNATRTGQRQ